MPAVAGASQAAGATTRSSSSSSSSAPGRLTASVSSLLPRQLTDIFHWTSYELLAQHDLLPRLEAATLHFLQSQPNLAHFCGFSLLSLSGVLFYLARRKRRDADALASDDLLPFTPLEDLDAMLRSLDVGGRGGGSTSSFSSTASTIVKVRGKLAPACNIGGASRSSFSSSDSGGFRGVTTTQRSRATAPLGGELRAPLTGFACLLYDSRCCFPCSVLSAGGRRMATSCSSSSVATSASSLGRAGSLGAVDSQNKSESLQEPIAFSRRTRYVKRVGLWPFALSERSCVPFCELRPVGASSTSRGSSSLNVPVYLCGSMLHSTFGSLRLDSAAGYLQKKSARQLPPHRLQQVYDFFTTELPFRLGLQRESVLKPNSEVVVLAEARIVQEQEDNDPPPQAGSFQNSSSTCILLSPPRSHVTQSAVTCLATNYGAADLARQWLWKSYKYLAAGFLTYSAGFCVLAARHLALYGRDRYTDVGKWVACQLVGLGCGCYWLREEETRRREHKFSLFKAAFGSAGTVRDSSSSAPPDGSRSSGAEVNATAATGTEDVGTSKASKAFGPSEAEAQREAVDYRGAGKSRKASSPARGSSRHHPQKVNIPGSPNDVFLVTADSIYPPAGALSSNKSRSGSGDSSSSGHSSLMSAAAYHSPSDSLYDGPNDYDSASFDNCSVYSARSFRTANTLYEDALSDGGTYVSSAEGAAEAHLAGEGHTLLRGSTSSRTGSGEDFLDVVDHDAPGAEDEIPTAPAGEDASRRREAAFITSGPPTATSFFSATTSSSSPPESAAAGSPTAPAPASRVSGPSVVRSSSSSSSSEEDSQSASSESVGDSNASNCGSSTSGLSMAATTRSVARFSVISADTLSLDGSETRKQVIPSAAVPAYRIFN